MVKVSETVHRAALLWVQALANHEAAEVTGFTDRTETVGTCKACSYTKAVVDIGYKTAAGYSNYATFDGGLAQFICELDQYDIPGEPDAAGN